MKNGDYLLIKAPKGYPGPKYRGKYCYEHCAVYWKTYGVIPNKNEVIHHKNGNKMDNRPDNLTLMNRNKHSKSHMSNNGKHMVDIRCLWCNKIFTVEYRQSFICKKTPHQCCSRECSKKLFEKYKHSRTFPKSEIIRDYYIFSNQNIIADLS